MEIEEIANIWRHVAERITVRTDRRVCPIEDVEID